MFQFKIFLYVLFFTLVNTLFSMTYSEGVQTSLSVGLEKQEGDITYEVGYKTIPVPDANERDNGFPISRLEFPIDMTLISITGDIVLKNFQFIIGLKKNLTGSDVMKDSDFRYNALPRLITYSENHSKADQYAFKASLLYKILTRYKLNLFAGVGYNYQKFEFITTNNFQMDYDDLSGWDYDKFNGHFIDYEVKFSYPFLEIKIDYHTKDSMFVFQAGISYSPFVEAEDKDIHHQTQRISSGVCDGDAYTLSLKGIYTIKDNLSFVLGGNYLRMDTDGRMRQDDFSGNTFGAVDETIDSEQLTIGLAIRFEF